MEESIETYQRKNITTKAIAVPICLPNHHNSSSLYYNI